MAAFGAMGSSSVSPLPAAHLLQQQKFDAHAAASWWNPGIGPMSAPVFDEALGTYAYGNENFQQQ